jgi:uncharacterized protein (TIGR04255 family)
MTVLPVALARDTIVECVFEMRFAAGHPAVAELLPGLVFGKLRSLFQNLTTLPLGQVPKLLRDQNPQLMYAPTYALLGERLRMMFGPRVTAVSFPKPYAGWKHVQPLIMECMNAVLDTKMTGRPERFSIKYVNLLQDGRNEYDLSQTNLRLQLGDFLLRDEGVIVRAEIERNGCITLVEIMSGGKVAATPGNPEAMGVLMSVDSVLKVSDEEPRAALSRVLETVHDTEKEIFFGMIAKPTLQKLGPTYPTRQ